MKSLLLVFLLLFCTLVQAQKEVVAPVQSGNTAPAEDTVYEMALVEQMAEYPGGQPALVAFLRENIKYPQDAREANIQGKVYVEFIIGKKGEVTKIKVKRGVYASLDKEAVRVVEMFPQWKPAVQNGKTVKQRYVLPINFKIEQPATEKK